MDVDLLVLVQSICDFELVLREIGCVITFVFLLHH